MFNPVGKLRTRVTRKFSTVELSWTRYRPRPVSMNYRAKFVCLVRFRSVSPAKRTSSQRML